MHISFGTRSARPPSPTAPTRGASSTGAEADHRARRVRRAERPTTVGQGAVVALLSAALTVPILRLWHLTWSVPLSYSGDANGVNSLFKGVLAHGWYLRNSNLGAPFGQDYRSFPFGDNLHLLLVKGLGLVSHDSSTVLNLVFLLTFPAVAVAAWWVFRRVGISNAVATVLSVLYTFAPYHFFRGEAHLFLTAYWVVPLGAFVVMRILSGDALGPVDRPPAAELGRADRARARRPRRLREPVGRVVPIALICVIVASASAYYGIFVMILALAASGLLAVQRRHLRALVPGLIVAAVICITTIANVVPSVVYTSSHGRSSNVATRNPAETEVWSLKIADLVLPRDHHRVSRLAAVSARYRTTFPLPSEGGGQALGVIAAIGFAWLVLVAVAGWAFAELRLVDGDQRRLASLTMVAVLVATTGGVSTLIALAGLSQVRDWNRMSIFIAFFALVSVGFGLDRLSARLNARGPGGPGWALVLVVVLVVGLVDQTSNADIPHYVGTRAEWNSDGTFVAAVEHALPANAMVYQYPYVPFPENPPVNSMVDYDELKGWLHSSSLRWSYGAFKGTPAAEWQPRLNQFPLSVVVPALAVIGFEGVTVDRAGYADGGDGVEAQLSAIAPGPAVTSPNGRLSFFDLHPLVAVAPQNFPGSQRQAVAQAALTVPEVIAGPGFYDLAGEGAGSTWSARQKGTLKLVSSVEQEVVLRTRLVGAPGTITFYLPDGSQKRSPVAPQGIDSVHQFRVKAGTNTIMLATDGTQMVNRAESRVVFFQLKDPTVAGVAFDRFAQSPVLAP